MTNLLLHHPLASLLLKMAVGSSLLLGVSLFLARLNRRGTATTRCFILQAGLLGVLFLPLVFLLPGRATNRVGENTTASETTTVTVPTAAPTEEVPTATIATPIETTVVSSPDNSLGSTDTKTGQPAEVPIETTDIDVVESQSIMPLVMNGIVAAWLLVSMVLTVRLCVSIARARRLVRSLTVPQHGAVAEVAKQFIQSNPRLLVGFADVMVPVTTGLWQHRILLPRDAMQWDADHTWMVLAHESAHAQRFDVFGALTCRLARAVVWFNPLAWLACRLAESEREVACDDQVLVKGGCAADYADCLLSMNQSRFGPSLAAVSIADPPLLTRVRSVLDSNQNRGRSSRVGRVGAGMLIAAVLLLCGAFHPTASVASALQEEVAATDVRTDKLGDPLEKHVIHRFGTRRFQHPEGVREICVSKDGESVITYGDQYVIGWDADTGKRLWQIERDRLTTRNIRLGTGYGIRAIARSIGTGEIVSIKTRQNTPLWNPRTGGVKELVFPEADEDTKSIDISSDGKLLALGGSRETIVCTRDGQKLFGIANNPKEDIQGVPDPRGRSRDRLGFPGEFSYARFTPDTKHLAVVNSEKPMAFQILDSRTGAVIREIKTTSRIVRFTITPDSKAVIATERDCGIRRYDVESGERTWEKKLPPSPNAESYTTGIDIHPDGQQIALGACLGPDRTVRILDANSGKELRKLKYPGWRPWTVHYSPDGKTLLSSGWSGGVHRWSTEKYELLPLPGGLRTSSICSIAGKANVLAFQDSTGTIHVVDQESGDTIRKLSLPDTGWSSIQFNSNGTLLASAGTSGDRIHLVVWNVADGKQLRNWSWDCGRDPHSQVYDITFWGDQIAAEVSRQSAAYVWDMKTGKQLTNVRHSGVFGSTLNEGKLVTAGWDMWIREWDSTTGRKLRSLQVGSYGPDGVLEANEDTRIYKVVVSPDRSLMATADMTRSIRVYDRNWNEVVTIPRAFGSQQAFAMSRNSLWVGRGGSELNVYDVATGDVVFQASAHQNGIDRVEFGPRDRTILTGGDDGVCNLWGLPSAKSDAGDDKLFANLVGSNGKLAFAAFRQLDADPDRAAKLLEARLSPFADSDVNESEVRKNIVALGSGRAPLVARAKAKLFALGPGVVPLLRQTVADEQLGEAKKQMLVKLAFSIHRRYRRASMLLAQLESDRADTVLQALTHSSYSKQSSAFFEAAAQYRRMLK